MDTTLILAQSIPTLLDPTITQIGFIVFMFGTAAAIIRLLLGRQKDDTATIRNLSKKVNELSAKVNSLSRQNTELEHKVTVLEQIVEKYKIKETIFEDTSERYDDLKVSYANLLIAYQEMEDERDRYAGFIKQARRDYLKLKSANNSMRIEIDKLKGKYGE